MTDLEIFDLINMDLTMSCSLPQILPTIEIKRLVEKIALPWFYEHHPFSVIRAYYYLPLDTLCTEQFTQYKYITLPDEIQNVIWTYQITDRSLFSLGFGTGNGQGNVSVNNGLTNQPYLNSMVTTIGELGVYKVIIDSFSDMLNQLSKHTLKFDYHFQSKKFHLLTSATTDIILETYSRIPAEDIFEMDHFKRYALALSKQQLGRLLTRYNMPLPGNVQINGEAIKNEGDTEIDKIKEEIKAMNANTFFFCIKK